MTHIFRTFFVLGRDMVMLLQAHYCPDAKMIRSVQVHPVINGVVGPILMTEHSFDASGIARLHAMIFNPDDEKEPERQEKHQR